MKKCFLLYGYGAYWANDTESLIKFLIEKGLLSKKGSLNYHYDEPISTHIWDERLFAKEYCNIGEDVPAFYFGNIDDGTESILFVNENELLDRISAVETLNPKFRNFVRKGCNFGEKMDEYLERDIFEYCNKQDKSDI